MSMQQLMLGRIYLTRGVSTRIAAAPDFGPFIVESLKRHAAGDWGEVDVDDKRANERALLDGTRLLSSYRDGHGERVWIITEADRAMTTVLFPHEY